MFDIGKFFSGFAFWRGESLGKIVFMVIIITVCLFIFWAAFVKRTTVYKIEKGGTAHIYEATTKKSPAHFIPYIDGSVGRYGGWHDNWGSADDGWEIRAGLRIEFDGIFDWLLGRK